MNAMRNFETDSYKPSAGVITSALVSDPIESKYLEEVAHKPRDHSAYFAYQRADRSLAITDLKSTVVILNEYREGRTAEPTILAETVEYPSENFVRKNLRSQLAEFRTIGDNWDGYGAEATKQTALKNAGYVIDKWDAPASVVTEAALLSDGCISFEFYDTKDDLLGALDVLDDGSASFALSINDVADVCSEISLENPSELKEFFKTLEKASAASEQRNFD